MFVKQHEVRSKKRKQETEVAGKFADNLWRQSFWTDHTLPYYMTLETFTIWTLSKAAILFTQRY